MNVKEILNNKEKVSIINEKGEMFEICYAGADLYWNLENYSKDNCFIVTEENGVFFKELRQLFSKMTLLDNTFEWYSEAYGTIENANKLVIKDDNDKFYIHFIQNPNHYMSKMRNTCYVCFCLSGSRNQQVASLFSIMFYNLRDGISVSCEKTKNKNKRKG